MRVNARDVRITEKMRDETSVKTQDWLESRYVCQTAASGAGRALFSSATTDAMCLRESERMRDETSQYKTRWRIH